MSKKTLTLELSPETHARLERAVEHMSHPTSKEVLSSEALLIGLSAIESALAELGPGPEVKA